MSKKKGSALTPFLYYESKSKSGKEKGYIRLTPSQFYSDAVMDLSANAHRVLICMKFQAKGNREFIYTYENATQDASISRQTFVKVIDELIQMKLIERIPTKAYAPSKFQFVEGWKTYHSPRRDLLTGDRRPKNWKKPKPQPKRTQKESEDETFSESKK